MNLWSRGLAVSRARGAAVLSPSRKSFSAAEPGFHLALRLITAYISKRGATPQWLRQLNVSTLSSPFFFPSLNARSYFPIYHL